MNAVTQISQSAGQRSRVIALHCSGASGAQWRNLAESLEEGWDIVAPDHFGWGSRGPWPGEHAFSLADEAGATLAAIDGSSQPCHLVGHSYGGAVALHAALQRPDKIASMVLYEPTAFHLLRHMSGSGMAAYREIASLAYRTNRGIVRGEYRDTVASFIDYWNGRGAWLEMRPPLQEALIRSAPKGPLEFCALLEEAASPCAYGALNCPVLILRGEHTRLPSRAIADYLVELMPNSHLTVLKGVGHMGPLTHPTKVNALILRHLSSLAIRHH